MKFYLCILHAACAKHRDPHSASKTERREQNQDAIGLERNGAEEEKLFGNDGTERGVRPEGNSPQTMKSRDNFADRLRKI